METGRRIGILHVISGLGLGGAEKMLLWSARHHDRDLVRMGVVSLISDGDLAGEVRQTGVRVYELGQRRGRLSPSSFQKLVKIIREFRPRILQGHMYHSNILVRLAGSLTGGMTVLSTRHIDTATPVRRLVNSATGFLNDGTLVFSQRVLDAERKENLFRRPIRLVPYGIEIPDGQETGREPGSSSGERERNELREKLVIPPDAFVWTAVGRLTRQKGFIFLVDAFSMVLENGGDSYLLIIGDGEDRGMLEKRVKKLGVDRRVFFCGFRSDVKDFLDISNAFVLSSLWEGGPLVLLEAMAAGLPVVSTCVGDASGMVKEGETGLLVEPGDPEPLADAMLRIQAMGLEARQWGQEGRRRVKERYDFKRVQKEMENYYREVAGWMGEFREGG